MSAKILMFGSDTLLLRTRAMLLEQSGFEVLTTEQFQDAKRAVAEQHLDVVILCHTLRTDETKGMLKEIHSLQPEVKTLILDEDETLSALNSNDESFKAFSGPENLLRTLNKMIN